MSPRRLPALFSDPDQSPGFLLWQAGNRWQRKQREALAELSLTPVQFVLLAGVVWLARDEERPVTQIRLARHTRTDVMMTSQVVRALLVKKLVRRMPHPTDSRAHALLPSSRGGKLARRSAYIVERVDRDFFAEAGSDLTRLVSGLRSLAAADRPGDESDESSA